jgi:hypothetical protein
MLALSDALIPFPVAWRDTSTIHIKGEIEFFSKKQSGSFRLNRRIQPRP